MRALEPERPTEATRTALLLGRILRDGVVTLVQATLMVSAALLFGLRASWQGVIIGLALMTVLGTALAAVSYSVALRSKNEAAFAPLLNSFVLPLVLLSGILLPMQLAPDWLYALSRINPLSYVVDAERAVFLGNFTSAAPTIGTVITIVFAGLAIGWGTHTFHRESR